MPVHLLDLRSGSMMCGAPIDLCRPSTQQRVTVHVGDATCYACHAVHRLERRTWPADLLERPGG